MDLITPDVGLLFWTLVSFSILYLILRKFAWGPILGAVKEREESIKAALDAADNAKKEMENLKADNEKILNEAKTEREAMLKEAREMKSKLISDAEYKDQFQWFLAIGLLFLFIEVFLFDTKTFWLKKLNLFNEN